MNRVLVLGCPGAGKTTFARRLAKRTGLDVVHLDAVWHRSDRTHLTREEFDKRLETLLARDRIILDGHYSRTLERRLAACDTVFLFDLPVQTCLAGARARLGREREDLPFVDEELSEELAERIRDFSRSALPEAMTLIEKHRAGRQIVIFHSRTEADDYLSRLGGRDEAWEEEK